MESIKISKDNFAWLVVGFFLGVIVLGILFLIIRQSRPSPIYITPAPPRATSAPTHTPKPLVIFINGQVAIPGVIELPQGSIVQDAIEASGGYTPKANTEVVNLALPLGSGMQIYVPGLDEEELTIPVVTNRPLNSGSDNLKVNINNATAVELEVLPGIGPSIAQRIIDYRLANGSFQDIKAIMNVSGIGPSKFEQFQEFISLE